MSVPERHGGLRRTLRFWDLVVYGLAYIAPISPLTTVGFVWQASDGLIVLAYVLGSVCMYFTAQSYAMMTDAIPTAGSVYGFARQALGRFPGFMAGWMILLDYLLIPAFVYVLVAVAFGELMPGVDRAFWIVFFSAFTLLVNWFGVTVTTKANFIAVIIQVVAVLALIVLGIAALYHGFGTGGLTTAPLYSSAHFSWGKIFSATSICVMSFLGFDAVSTLSEEVAPGAHRDVGRAIIAVLVISAGFFVLLTFVVGNLLPAIKIQDPSAAVYELARAAIGSWAAIALAWIYAIVVGLSNALPMQVGVSRVLFAMGRDRQLPSVLARVHARHATPWVAMVVTTVLSTAVALLMRNLMDELADIVNFGALCGFLLLHVSVIARFGRRAAGGELIKHRLFPLLGILVVGAVLYGMSPLAKRVGLSWMVGGLVLGWILRLRHRDELHASL